MAMILFLVVLALVGLPLFAVLGGIGIVASQQSDLDPMVLIIELYRLASQPNLMAIPLFTLAGMTMAHGGAAGRLVRLFNALFGWLPGGIAIVSIISCAFFTAFTGASGITIIALGGLLFPLFIKSHYSENFSLGLLTSAGSLGLLFPPSLAVLIYGIVSGVSIDQLFLAGMLPGAILLILLSVYSFFTARKQHLGRHLFHPEDILPAIKHSAADILLPILIISGIFGGFTTVNEAAALTCVYTLLMESRVYKTINLTQDLATIFIDTSKLVGSILIILATAMGLTNLLIDAQIPTRLVHFFDGMIHTQLEFLLLLNLLLLLVGAMMDIFSAIIVVAPLVIPLARQYGIDPVHLGIVFLANLEIGYLTPPVGINLFIASQRFQQPILRLFRTTLPFLAIMLLWLLLITYVPSLSLWWR